MRKIKTEKWEKEDILSSSDFEEMKFVIYLLENKITKECYVGYTTNTFICRIKRHIYYSKRHTAPINEAIKEFGIENFNKTILLVNENVNFLKNMEVMFIKILDTKIPFGYNCTAGGAGVVFLDKKSLKKLSLSQPNRREVSQYDLDGNFLNSYHSLAEAMRITGIGRCNIRNCCNSLQVQAGFFIWRWFEETRGRDLNLTIEDIEKIIGKKDKLVNRIDAYNKEGKLVLSFNTLKDAASHMKTSCGSIQGGCKNRDTIFIKGLIWRYRRDAGGEKEINIDWIEKRYEKNRLAKSNAGKLSSKKVNCFNLDGIFIKSYVSIAEAGRKNRIYGNNICTYIKKNKPYIGFIWKYADEVDK